MLLQRVAGAKPHIHLQRPLRSEVARLPSPKIRRPMFQTSNHIPDPIETPLESGVPVATDPKVRFSLRRSWLCWSEINARVSVGRKRGICMCSVVYCRPASNVGFLYNRAILIHSADTACSIELSGPLLPEPQSFGSCPIQKHRVTG